MNGDDEFIAAMLAKISQGIGAILTIMLSGVVLIWLGNMLNATEPVNFIILGGLIVTMGVVAAGVFVYQIFNNIGR
jgi:hypothetical protein